MRPRHGVSLRDRGRLEARMVCMCPSLLPRTQIRRFRWWHSCRTATPAPASCASATPIGTVLPMNTDSSPCSRPRCLGTIQGSSPEVGVLPTNCPLPAWNVYDDPDKPDEFRFFQHMLMMYAHIMRSTAPVFLLPAPQWAT